MPKSAWTEKDQIDNFLKERRLMRSLESSLVGDCSQGDLQLRQKNHMILSYDVLIIQELMMGDDGDAIDDVESSGGGDGALYRIFGSLHSE
ncbi:hypothetical protein Tco_1123226 [Tanacetum coccineum]|uniref:Uncharacterized protein n=1 Tax=Tanacetum coccineum TaxID=301880 RepID=A0ABQ5J3A9_9ASTR